jgi:hypothetical protein
VDVTAAIGLNVSDLFYKRLAGSELTEEKRRRYEEVLIAERFQVAITDSAERNERPLTTFEQERRLLGQHRISKLEVALNE